MNERMGIERLLDDWIAAEAPARAEAVVLAGVLARIGDVGQRRPLLGVHGLDHRSATWVRLAVLAGLLALALVGVALLAGSLRSDPVVPTTVGPQNGWIVYAKEGERDEIPAGGTTDDLHYDLYATRPGVEPRRIAGFEGDPVSQRCPSFSPDGSVLAYRDGASLVLARFEAGGSLGAEVLRAPQTGCVTWAPDGRHLAEVHAPGVNTDGALSVLAFDGTSVRRVATTRSGDVYGVSWAPDGTRLAMVQAVGEGRAQGGLGTLSIVEVDGTRHELLDSMESVWLAKIVSGIDWSPDGETIAVEASNASIWLISPDGSGLRLLVGGVAALGGDGAGPVWSSDGRRIAVHQDEGIAIVDAAYGTTLRGIPGQPRSGVLWSPDGGSLLYLEWGGEGRRWAPAIVAVEGPSKHLTLTPGLGGFEWAETTDFSWQTVPEVR